MNFAFCIFKYSPNGGMEHNFMRILNACRAQGHSIDIYTMSWRGECPTEISIFLVPYSGLTNHARSLSYIQNLKQQLRYKHYNAIVGFNRMPGLDVYYAADICYERNVCECHSFLYRLLPRYRVLSSLERAVFDPQIQTQIMLPCEAEKHYFIQHYGTPLERFHTLPPGISQAYRPPPHADQIRTRIRAQYEIGEHDQVLLFIAYNFKLKGLDRTLKALAALPQTIQKHTFLWVIGPRSKTRPYRWTLKRLGLTDQVRFLGVSHNLPELLLGGDALIHPSRKDSAGMVLVEAIVSGKPVLTTASCGFASHVERAKAGIVIPIPFQQILLNQALITLLTDHTQRRKWQKNALHYGQTQDLYGRSEKVTRIIENAAHQKRVNKV